jgi:hypothetical protein
MLKSCHRCSTPLPSGRQRFSQKPGRKMPSAYAARSYSDDHWTVAKLAFECDARFSRTRERSPEGMDDVELKPENADVRRAAREYAWFAITLLGIIALVVFRTNT